MSYGIAGAAAIAVLSLSLGGCGDRSNRSSTPDPRTIHDKPARPLSPMARAALDACLAKVVVPPWRIVRTQAFAENLSISIEAESDVLKLPHRSIDMPQQRYVRISFGQNSQYKVPPAESRRADIARGALRPVNEVAGIPAAEFAPLVPYHQAGTILFLNIPGEEYCTYQPALATSPNPFVVCRAKLREYTASLTLPYDAITHLSALFADVRPRWSGMASCSDLAKE